MESEKICLRQKQTVIAICNSLICNFLCWMPKRKMQMVCIAKVLCAVCGTLKQLNFVRAMGREAQKAQTKL